MTRLQEFLKALSEKCAKTYYVGGYVRDKILGKENKDIDIEIHYITEEEFLDACKSFGLDIKLCGQAFGVYKAVIDGQDIDFSFPRTEKLIGTKHTDFEIAVDPFIGEEKASMRRDFTINALMMDTQTGTILDFHKGMKDLEDKIIRHTSDKFSEDALRVYRAAQFASRFGFTVAPETLELCERIDVVHLPQERIQEETYKAFTKGTPSIYFDILKSIGIELVKEYRSIDKIAKKYDVEMCMAYLAKCDSSFGLTTHKSKKCFELLHFMSDIHSMVNLQEYACEEYLMSQLAKSWVSRKFDDSMISVVFDVFSLDTSIKTEKEQLEFTQFIKSVKEQYLTSKELMELGYTGQGLGKALKEMKYLACEGLTREQLLEKFRK
jgi:tRNA nucleotidyltransferase/poly(A) polymerase